VLSFADFMGVVLDLRGTNTATIRDITQLRRHINGRFTRLEQKLLETLQTPQCSNQGRVQLNKSSTEPLVVADRPSNQWQALHGLVDTVIQQCKAEHERDLEALRAEIQSSSTGSTEMRSRFQKPTLLGICPGLPEPLSPPTSASHGGRCGLANTAPGPAVSDGPPEQRRSGVMPVPCGRPTLRSSSPARKKPHKGQQAVPSQPTEALSSASLPGAPVPKVWVQQAAAS